jgi:predicted nucleic acid-binding protein
MLDTNISSYIIKGFIEKEKLLGKNIGLSSIVVCKLYTEQKRKTLKNLLKS